MKRQLESFKRLEDGGKDLGVLARGDQAAVPACCFCLISYGQLFSVGVIRRGTLTFETHFQVRNVSPQRLYVAAKPTAGFFFVIQRRLAKSTMFGTRQTNTWT